MKPLILKLDKINVLNRFNPVKSEHTNIRWIVSTFIIIILMGAFLLTLPISSTNGTRQSFIDALFTATSALSTTGLVVVDTGSYYSLFGELVVLSLIQIGGIGYMVFIIAAAYALKKRISLNGKVMASESLIGASMGEMKKLVKATVIYSLIFELGAALLLAVYFSFKFPLSYAIYLGIFHSISAFSTAGFGLFSDSFMSYQGSVFINWVLNITSIVGGIGFFVLYDLDTLCRKKFNGIFPRRLSVHTKLAITVSLILMSAATVIIFFAEKHSGSFGLDFLTASFQAISASTTTGFNSVDIGTMTTASLLAIIMLMFIGSSPGSTGGGIKTTTLGVLITFLVTMFRGEQDVNIYQRRASFEAVNKAFSILLMAIVILVTGTFLLTMTENAPFIKLLFEVTSALGTIGLSTGITPALSFIGKIVIIMIMFIGRVGPLAFGFALFGKTKHGTVRYAQGNIFVG